MEESKDTAKLGLLKEPDKTLISHLVGGCQKAGIEHKLDVSEDGTYHLSILIPCGREKREVSIMWPEDATEFSHIEFEKHRFVQGYEAICSYEYGTIEAYIRPLRGFSRDSLFSLKCPILPMFITNTTFTSSAHTIAEQHGILIGNGDQIAEDLSYPPKFLK